MDSVEDYARRWSKDEEAELDSFSEWIKAIRRLLKRKMSIACRYVNNKPQSVLMTIKLFLIWLIYMIIVPADKAPNNLFCTCVCIMSKSIVSFRK